MREALALAERGRGRVRPNPTVGAVLVKKGRIVGRGWHRRLGGPHAEIEALRDAGTKAKGATLYVTLEPCAHHGRTGPCADAIIAAQVERVVAATRDPFPAVDGRGFRRLRRAGIAVTTPVLEAEARDAMAGYLSVHEAGRPRVSLKLAVSLDGRIAPAKGPARWITGPEARRAAHHLRARHDVVLVGANTVRNDDPELTVRDAPLHGNPQPLRVVVSNDLALPVRSRLFTKALAAGTVVATVAPELVPRARGRGGERRRWSPEGSSGSSRGSGRAPRARGPASRSALGTTATRGPAARTGS
jgi:diaminohydroxyphosphoribosylaminopyrimidine deaminase/5-amino-6-(5-phosphoribosylamino)uracil reductase